MTNTLNIAGWPSVLKNVTEKNRIHVNIRIGSANVDVILNNFVIKVCFCFTFSIFHYVEK